MFHFTKPQPESRNYITNNYRCDEKGAIEKLLQVAQMSESEKAGAKELALRLVKQIRESRKAASGVDALMLEFSLSSEEGVALMCLAEALLRIPDKSTREKLIRDKLADGKWQNHLHNSPSLFVNAAAWGLLITGKITSISDEKTLSNALTRVLAKGGQPLINVGIDYAMRLMGKQFITGQTIEEALQNGKKREDKGYRFSFDMLGEAAMTEADAERYYRDYMQAIHAIGSDNAGRGVYDGNGLSVKLSAIHPRYSRAQHQRVMSELLPRLKSLFMLAKQYNIGLNIDAEEANRLELSLDLMKELISDRDLHGFHGIGFVVQAYQKRAPYVLKYLINLAREYHQKLMIRLVKGAYWDSEIKWTQIDGLSDYPVYTRKVHTDVSYLACARILFSAQDVIFPQFATHNAYTLAAIYQLGEGKEYEFQGLHGMGETLYDRVVGVENLNRRCRIYAPVGTHETLLAYLVRRLLENGANTSFVNQIVDENIDLESLVQCPLDIATGERHIHLPLPANIYGAERVNSKGFDLTNEFTLELLEKGLNNAATKTYFATSITAVEVKHISPRDVFNPANLQEKIGEVRFLAPDQIINVVNAAKLPLFSSSERASILRRYADLLESHAPTLMMLAIREAGKTINNAIAEIREAVDFCRYYAHEAETTIKERAPIGLFAAISPWNFPLAIFVGEVVAAFAAGNAVIAKPAEQTSLIAHYAIQLLHYAGVPKTAVQLILGAGDIGAALTQNKDIAGVIFTGSTEVAHAINKTLAGNMLDKEIRAKNENKVVDFPVFIGETGGMNAMIVDSSALAEQVCADVINSAFDSAGQRCSALRILCIQEEIAESLISMIKGAMNELTVANPIHLSTDIGPVIDAEAKAKLERHIEIMKLSALNYHEIPKSEGGYFVAPILFELKNLDALNQEVFGPVLHVIRYQSKDLQQIIKQINSKGYALTHGIHTRVDETMHTILETIEAGNIYVNRNIVGAVVGVQPFGGYGLSGTGPKAGGPFYLQKLSRGPWVMPHLTKQPITDEQQLNVLSALVDSFEHKERVKLAGVRGESRVHNLRGAETDLTSYTGEKNTLSWRAPKAVFLYGGNRVRATEAVLRLAAAGIKVLISQESSLADIAPIQGVLEFGDWSGVRHVIALDDMASDMWNLFAARDGSLLKVIDARQVVDIFQVFEEISLSVNTTAAGGNALLMAQSDKF